MTSHQEQLLIARTAELEKELATKNRELEIAAALEQVRARTMAMQKSDELGDASFLLFQQFKALGETSDQVSIGIFDGREKIMKLYSTVYGSQWRAAAIIDLDEPIVMKNIYAGRKNNKNSLVIDLSGDDLRKYNAYRKNISTLDYKETRWIIHVAFFSKGVITFSTTEPRQNGTIHLLERFAAVFDGTYTRFLDLQKAETHAKEAQLESALEKVRSRSLSMHKSDELNDVVMVLFEKLKDVQIPVTAVGITIYIEGSRDLNMYVCGDIGTGLVINNYVVPYFDHPIPNDFHDVREKSLDFFVGNYSKEEKKSFYNYVLNLPGLQDLPAEIQNMIMQSPSYSITMAPAKHSMISLNDFEGKSLSESESDILKRFARVFEQAYVRFLDLQKSEAQARESQIQLALERVRARTMAMFKSDELSETAVVVCQQLIQLGIEPNRLYIGIINDESGDLEFWMTDEKGKQVANRYVVNIHNNISIKKIYEGWKEQLQTVSIDMSGNELHEWITYWNKEFGVPFMEGAGQQRRVQNFAYFSKGFIATTTFENAPKETVSLLHRFAAVFNLTYTRFNDLKKAEASTREAVKRATLDRIRADIASMRTINDLDRITPLIWNELTILGIPFIRCGVFIMDNEQQLIHTFLSTPDGKAIAAFNIPYATTGNIKQIVLHWQSNEKYIDHWDRSEFKDFADILVTQGALASTEQYLRTIPEEGFHLHFLPFLQGMLYVGNTDRLNEEETNLLQSVADAFSTAYARYEDFNKLEAAKKQVDSTLDELQTTQKQLIQSEKMASLGELTAGIAHEIQNPLNFVNNFSDVSGELIDEMKTELTMGNTNEAISIAEDVKQNIEKILFHGKRADSIVKGMLQHSRATSTTKEPTDINALVDEYLRLAYHGLRAKDKSFNATMQTDYDETIGKIKIIPQDIGRVVLNIITNAFYAVTERGKLGAVGYEPVVSVTTRKIGSTLGDGAIEIKVADNGGGIPKTIIDKIFQPFFTTKPTGQGTGLGLSLSYDIVKAHGGEILVQTKLAEGSEFTIHLLGMI